MPVSVTDVEAVRSPGRLLRERVTDHEQEKYSAGQPKIEFGVTSRHRTSRGDALHLCNNFHRLAPIEFAEWFRRCFARRGSAELELLHTAHCQRDGCNARGEARRLQSTSIDTLGNGSASRDVI